MIKKKFPVNEKINIQWNKFNPMPPTCKKIVLNSLADRYVQLEEIVV